MYSRHQSPCNGQNTEQNIQIMIELVGQITKDAGTYLHSVKYDQASNKFSINLALLEICKVLPSLEGSQIFLIDYKNQIKEFLGNYPFNLDVEVGFDNIYQGVIHLTYRHPTVNNLGQRLVESPEKEEKNQVTKRKVKERTIEEAVLAVQKWRQYYDKSDSYGRRVYTLDQAAKMVGVAKKTLDDYYNHLRIANQYNFNIERFKGEKVGLLRKFVKVHREQGQFRVRELFFEYFMDPDVDEYWVDFSNQ